MNRGMLRTRTYGGLGEAAPRVVRGGGGGGGGGERLLHEFGHLAEGGGGEELRREDGGVGGRGGGDGDREDGESAEGGGGRHPGRGSGRRRGAGYVTRRPTPNQRQHKTNIKSRCETSHKEQPIKSQ